MSVQSQWRLRELLLGDDDPFASVILSSGLHVDLTGTQDELYAGLRRSLGLEERLFNKGVTCPLKDDGQDCLTCAEYVADRQEEPRAPLCRLGRDQRLIEQRYEEGKISPFEELAATADELSEIGHIDPEYVELLAHAGY